MEWWRFHFSCSALNGTNLPYVFIFFSWFTYFYVVGSSLSWALLWMLINHCSYNNTSITNIVAQVLDLDYNPHVDCFTVLVSLLLLLAQTCRRLFECLFISVFTGKIHISHYLVGVSFYVLDVTSIAASFLRGERIDKGGYPTKILFLCKIEKKSIYNNFLRTPPPDLA